MQKCLEFTAGDVLFSASLLYDDDDFFFVRSPSLPSFLTFLFSFHLEILVVRDAVASRQFLVSYSGTSPFHDSVNVFYMTW